MRSALRLSRHADLKTRREGDILVLPERAVRLAGSGGEILRLCTIPRSEDDIVAAIRLRYPESAEVDREVREFLGQMLRIGALVACEDAGDDPT